MIIIEKIILYGCVGLIMLWCISATCVAYGKWNEKYKEREQQEEDEEFLRHWDMSHSRKRLL